MYTCRGCGVSITRREVKMDDGFDPNAPAEDYVCWCEPCATAIWDAEENG